MRRSMGALHREGGRGPRAFTIKADSLVTLPTGKEDEGLGCVFFPPEIDFYLLFGHAA